MSGTNYILMGDVVSSSEYDSTELRNGLKEVVQACNDRYSNGILSPLTITLGDEFQGIIDSTHTALSILFFLEESCLSTSPYFKLHYVFHAGHIDTDINPDIAHEMMGSGLTKARALLTDKKRGRNRFIISLEDTKISEQMNRLFRVLESIIDKWKEIDYPLILDMINNDNNQEVGDMHDKNRDQIWKRRKTLMIEEYNLLKRVILDYV